MTTEEQLDLIWSLVEMVMIQTIDNHFDGNTSQFKTSFTLEGQAVLDKVAEFRGHHGKA